MKTLAALVLTVSAALLVSGCASEPVDWNGDARFTETERTQIETGAAWLYAQAGLPAPHISWNYEVTSAEALPKTIRRERGPSGDSGATGLCSSLDGNGTVYLGVEGDAAKNEAPIGDALPGLAAHELAHCVLGFVDGYHPGEKQTDGIMRNLAPMAWTDAEQAQCREHADRCLSGK